MHKPLGFSIEKHEEKQVFESASVGIQIKYQRPKSSSWKHNMEADAICDEREKKNYSYDPWGKITILLMLQQA